MSQSQNPGFAKPKTFTGAYCNSPAEGPRLPHSRTPGFQKSQPSHSPHFELCFDKKTPPEPRHFGLDLSWPLWDTALQDQAAVAPPRQQAPWSPQAPRPFPSAAATTFQRSFKTTGPKNRGIRFSCVYLKVEQKSSESSPV